MTHGAIIQPSSDKSLLRHLIKKRIAFPIPPCAPGGSINHIHCCPPGCAGGVRFNGIASPSCSTNGDCYTCGSYCFTCYILLTMRVLLLVVLLVSSRISSRIDINLSEFHNSVNYQCRKSIDKVLNNIGQEHILIKVDIQEKYAYGFADSFILSYTLLANELYQNNKTNVVHCDGDNGPFIPHAADLNNILNSENIGYNHESIMSTSIDHFGMMAEVGQAQLDTVTITFINDSNTPTNISEMYQIVEDVKLIDFGRSVAWLDDKGTLAVLIAKSGNRSGLWGRSYLFILVHARNLLILRDDGKLIHIPSTDPGFCSMEHLEVSEVYRELLTCLDSDICASLSVASLRKGSSTKESTSMVYSFLSKRCVSGTYKSTTGFGPCTVCPSGTTNPGGNKSSDCQPCKPVEFCSLGASSEVNVTVFNSTTQVFNYPDSPITDNYDDVLLLNFIPSTWTAGCVLSSPLFVAVLFIILSFIILLIILTIKKRQPTSFDTHRERAKRILKHTDLIGEEERLVGGLASIAIFPIIIYSIVFAVYYFFSYSSDST
ncbi:unnamed protein product [Rotaria socialis]|uniref:Uncharacterized protein n=1 Tax=Rotaria socialis TaxID=392032 RepID=A0A818SYB3_9BILA|nr:unnamed protein product [Rotaria socialis]